MLTYFVSCIVSLVVAPFLILLWAIRMLDENTSRRLLRGLYVGLYIAIAIIAALVGAIALSLEAHAFPDMVRHGYPSCASCHVAAAGGELTTAYGRNISESLLSTWSEPGEAEPAWGLFERVDWLEVGGNLRAVDTSRIDPFLMESQAEVAVTPIPAVTVAASFGSYGPGRRPAARTNYVLVRLGDHLSVRVGRFLAAYGVGDPDHTIATRVGTGIVQGAESYSAEAALVGEAGEVIVTGVYGAAARLAGSTERGYVVTSRDQSGVVVRAARYVGGRTQIGASFLSLANADASRRAVGWHAIVGFTDAVYLLAEYDRLVGSDVAAARLGVEATRGVHLGLIGDYGRGASTGGGQLQWFPRPHLSFLTELTRSSAGLTEALILAHYYL